MCSKLDTNKNSIISNKKMIETINKNTICSNEMLNARSNYKITPQKGFNSFCHKENNNNRNNLITLNEYSTFIFDYSKIAFLNDILIINLKVRVKLEYLIKQIINCSLFTSRLELDEFAKNIVESILVIKYYLHNNNDLKEKIVMNSKFYFSLFFLLHLILCCKFEVEIGKIIYEEVMKMMNNSNIYNNTNSNDKDKDAEIQYYLREIKLNIKYCDFSWNHENNKEKNKHINPITEIIYNCINKDYDSNKNRNDNSKISIKKSKKILVLFEQLYKKNDFKSFLRQLKDGQETKKNEYRSFFENFYNINNSKASTNIKLIAEQIDFLGYERNKVTLKLKKIIDEDLSDLRDEINSLILDDYNTLSINTRDYFLNKANELIDDYNRNINENYCGKEDLLKKIQTISFINHYYNRVLLFNKEIKILQTSIYNINSIIINDTNNTNNNIKTNNLFIKNIVSYDNYTPEEILKIRINKYISSLTILKTEVVETDSILKPKVFINQLLLFKCSFIKHYCHEECDNIIKYYNNNNDDNNNKINKDYNISNIIEFDTRIKIFTELYFDIIKDELGSDDSFQSNTNFLKYINCLYSSYICYLISNSNIIDNSSVKNKNCFNYIELEHILKMITKNYFQLWTDLWKMYTNTITNSNINTNKATWYSFANSCDDLFLSCYNNILSNIRNNSNITSSDFNFINNYNIIFYLLYINNSIVNIENRKRDTGKIEKYEYQENISIIKPEHYYFILSDYDKEISNHLNNNSLIVLINMYYKIFISEKKDYYKIIGQKSLNMNSDINNSSYSNSLSLIEYLINFNPINNNSTTLELIFLLKHIEEFKHSYSIRDQDTIVFNNSYFNSLLNYYYYYNSIIRRLNYCNSIDDINQSNQSNLIYNLPIINDIAKLLINLFINSRTDHVMFSINYIVQIIEIMIEVNSNTDRSNTHNNCLNTNIINILEQLICYFTLGINYFYNPINKDRNKNKKAVQVICKKLEEVIIKHINTIVNHRDTKDIKTTKTNKTTNSINIDDSTISEFFYHNLNSYLFLFAIILIPEHQDNFPKLKLFYTGYLKTVEFKIKKIHISFLNDVEKIKKNTNNKKSNSNNHRNSNSNKKTQELFINHYNNYINKNKSVYSCYSSNIFSESTIHDINNIDLIISDKKRISCLSSLADINNNKEDITDLSINTLIEISYLFDTIINLIDLKISLMIDFFSFSKIIYYNACYEVFYLLVKELNAVFEKDELFSQILHYIIKSKVKYLGTVILRNINVSGEGKRNKSISSFPFEEIICENNICLKSNFKDQIYLEYYCFDFFYAVISNISNCDDYNISNSDSSNSFIKESDVVKFDKIALYQESFILYMLRSFFIKIEVFLDINYLNHSEDINDLRKDYYNNSESNNNNCFYYNTNEYSNNININRNYNEDDYSNKLTTLISNLILELDLFKYFSTVNTSNNKVLILLKHIKVITQSKYKNISLLKELLLTLFMISFYTQKTYLSSSNSNDNSKSSDTSILKDNNNIMLLIKSIIELIITFDNTKIMILFISQILITFYKIIDSEILFLLQNNDIVLLNNKNKNSRCNNDNRATIKAIEKILNLPQIEFIKFLKEEFKYNSKDTAQYSTLINLIKHINVQKYNTTNSNLGADSAKTTDSNIIIETIKESFNLQENTKLKSLFKDSVFNLILTIKNQVNLLNFLMINTFSFDILAKKLYSYSCFDNLVSFFDIQVNCHMKKKSFIFTNDLLDINNQKFHQVNNTFKTLSKRKKYTLEYCELISKCFSNYNNGTNTDNENENVNDRKEDDFIRKKFDEIISDCKYIDDISLQDKISNINTYENTRYMMNNINSINIITSHNKNDSNLLFEYNYNFHCILYYYIKALYSHFDYFKYFPYLNSTFLNNFPELLTPKICLHEKLELDYNSILKHNVNSINNVISTNLRRTKYISHSFIDISQLNQCFVFIDDAEKFDYKNYKNIIIDSRKIKNNVLDNFEMLNQGVLGNSQFDKWFDKREVVIICSNTDSDVRSKSLYNHCDSEYRQKHKYSIYGDSYCEDNINEDYKEKIISKFETEVLIKLDFNLFEIRSNANIKSNINGNCNIHYDQVFSYYSILLKNLRDYFNNNKVKIMTNTNNNDNCYNYHLDLLLNPFNSTQQALKRINNLFSTISSYNESNENTNNPNSQSSHYHERKYPIKASLSLISFLVDIVNKILTKHDYKHSSFNQIKTIYKEIKTIFIREMKSSCPDFNKETIIKTKYEDINSHFSHKVLYLLYTYRIICLFLNEINESYRVLNLIINCFINLNYSKQIIMEMNEYMIESYVYFPMIIEKNKKTHNTNANTNNDKNANTEHTLAYSSFYPNRKNDFKIFTINDNYFYICTNYLKNKTLILKNYNNIFDQSNKTNTTIISNNCYSLTLYDALAYRVIANQLTCSSIKKELINEEVIKSKNNLNTNNYSRSNNHSNSHNSIMRNNIENEYNNSLSEYISAKKKFITIQMLFTELVYLVSGRNDKLLENIYKEALDLRSTINIDFEIADFLKYYGRVVNFELRKRNISNNSNINDNNIFGTNLIDYKKIKFNNDSDSDSNEEENIEIINNSTNDDNFNNSIIKNKRLTTQHYNFPLFTQKHNNSSFTKDFDIKLTKLQLKEMINNLIQVIEFDKFLNYVFYIKLNLNLKMSNNTCFIEMKEDNVMFNISFLHYYKRIKEYFKINSVLVNYFSDDNNNNLISIIRDSKRNNSNNSNNIKDRDDDYSLPNFLNKLNSTITYSSYSLNKQSYNVLLKFIYFTIRVFSFPENKLIIYLEDNTKPSFIDVLIEIIEIITILSSKTYFKLISGIKEHIVELWSSFDDLYNYKYIKTSKFNTVRGLIKSIRNKLDLMISSIYLAKNIEESFLFRYEINFNYKSFPFETIEKNFIDIWNKEKYRMSSSNNLDLKYYPNKCNKKYSNFNSHACKNNQRNSYYYSNCFVCLENYKEFLEGNYNDRFFGEGKSIFEEVNFEYLLNELFYMSISDELMFYSTNTNNIGIVKMNENKNDKDLTNYSALLSLVEERQRYFYVVSFHFYDKIKSVLVYMKLKKDYVRIIKEINETIMNGTKEYNINNNNNNNTKNNSTSNCSNIPTVKILPPTLDNFEKDFIEWIGISYLNNNHLSYINSNTSVTNNNINISNTNNNDNIRQPVYLLNLSTKIDSKCSVSEPAELIFTATDNSNHSYLVKGEHNKLITKEIMSCNYFINFLKLYLTSNNNNNNYFTCFKIISIDASKKYCLVEMIKGKSIDSILDENLKVVGLENNRPKYKNEEEFCKISADKNILFKTFINNNISYAVRKLKFTCSNALWSLTGYLLGLGDRHSSNIFIEDFEIRHIDFGFVLDEGTRQNVPELVPFRNTTNMRYAMGIVEEQGAFRYWMLAAHRIMQEHSILFTYFFESLNSSIEKDNNNITRMKKIDENILNLITDGETFVDKLIKESKSITRLLHMFHGFNPGL